MTVFMLIYIFVVGLLIGSFANVVIFRLPEGRSVITPRSACGNCGRTLGVQDLVPVFSWLVLRGKCRTCGSSISWRYPLVELAMGLGFLLLAIAFPLLEYGAGTLLPLLALFAVLFMAAMIDVDTLMLPDSLTLPALAFALVASWLYHPAAGLAQGLESLQAAGVAAGIIVLINRVGSLVLRRFADTRERLPLGMDQVNLAALGGAIGGVWLGLGLALASLLLNLFSKRIWRIPEPILYGAWLLALLLSIYNPLGIPRVLLGSTMAAGWVALLGACYWWITELRMSPAERTAYTQELESDPAADEPVAMGFGDVKLMAALGAILGIPAAIVAMLIAVMLGAVGGIVGRMLGGDRVIPFGPYLALGGLIALLVGNDIASWYLSMLSLG